MASKKSPNARFMKKELAPFAHQKKIELAPFAPKKKSELAPLRDRKAKMARSAIASEFHGPAAAAKWHPATQGTGTGDSTRAPK